jgi:hypothetical protein
MSLVTGHLTIISDESGTQLPPHQLDANHLPWRCQLGAGGWGLGTGKTKGQIKWQTANGKSQISNGKFQMVFPFAIGPLPFEF